MKKTASVITVEGLDALEKTFRTLPKKMGRHVLQQALRSGAKPIVAAAKARVPVKTGKLRNSIIARTQRTGSSSQAELHVGPSGKARRTVGHLVEFGTAPHKIKAPLFKKLRLLDGTMVKSVMHPGSPPQPFLRPAFDETAAAAEEIIRSKMIAGVEKAARKLASKPKGKKR